MGIPIPPQVLIRAKLADGRLAINSIPRVGSWPGNGETCDACEKIVTREQFLMKGIDVAGSRTPIQLHVECFRLWNEERRALQTEGANGEALTFEAASRFLRQPPDF